MDKAIPKPNCFECRRALNQAMNSPVIIQAVFGDNNQMGNNSALKQPERNPQDQETIDLLKKCIADKEFIIELLTRKTG